MSDIISVTGVIELDLFTPENALALKEQTWQSGCGFNITDDCIYLSDLNNSHMFLENYCLYVAGLLPDGHMPLTFKCKGETVDDVRDLIIEDKRVFIQYYSLEKSGDRKEYKGE